MDEHNDGGPAFPVHGGCGDDPRNQILGGGMSLRDYFAARAVQGMCAHLDTWGKDINGIAKEAYAVADAMLKARDL